MVGGGLCKYLLGEFDQLSWRRRLRGREQRVRAESRPTSALTIWSSENSALFDLSERGEHHSDFVLPVFFGNHSDEELSVFHGCRIKRKENSYSAKAKQLRSPSSGSFARRRLAPLFLYIVRGSMSSLSEPPKTLLPVPSTYFSKQMTPNSIHF